MTRCKAISVNMCSSYWLFT